MGFVLHLQGATHRAARCGGDLVADLNGPAVDYAMPGVLRLEGAAGLVEPGPDDPGNDDDRRKDRASKVDDSVTTLLLRGAAVPGSELTRGVALSIVDGGHESSLAFILEAQGYPLELRSSVTLRLLAVHAHPDDESSKGAGTYAYYRSIGVEAAVVSCTGGERGDVLNERLEARAHAERDIAGLRRIELARAQAIVGFEHFWLGYADSGLPDAVNPDVVDAVADPYGRDWDEPLPANCFALIPLEISAEPLVAIIRRFRPQVLVAYDENGGYPHPDHIRAHEVAMFALEAAADPLRYPDAGEPWQIVKTYYERIFNYSRIAALHEELQETDPNSPLLEDLAWFRERLRDALDTSTTHVDVADFLEVRDAALRAHESQVAPDSPFFFWPNDLQRVAWPYEDFQLVRSLVETPLPENDLFSGITNNQKVIA